MFALWRHLRTESEKQLVELLNTMTCEIWKLIFLWRTGSSFQPFFFQPNSNSRGDKEASCIPLTECSSSLCTFHWFVNIMVQWDWMATILPWNTETARMVRGIHRSDVWDFKASDSYSKRHRASPSLAAKNIINLISVSTIWWCSCVESSLVLLEEGVYYDQCILILITYD